MCLCQICERYKKIRGIIDSRDPDLLINLVEDLMDCLSNEELDNEVHRCIMNGTWPGSKEILLTALDKANSLGDTNDMNTDAI